MFDRILYNINLFALGGKKIVNCNERQRPAYPYNWELVGNNLIA